MMTMMMKSFDRIVSSRVVVKVHVSAGRYDTAWSDDVERRDGSRRWYNDA